MRGDWSDLPDGVLGAIMAHTGPIQAVEPAPAGNHADVAATVHAGGERLFVKAARKSELDSDGPEVRSLRWEAAINPHVAEYAPRLRWTVEVGGWFVLAFEHVRARHADYAPGSADLDVLAKVIDGLRTHPVPSVLARKRVERRWEAMADVTVLAGDTLLHADLNPANVLLGADGSVYLVDWAFAGRGAAFLELALLVPWLLKAGHTPAEAEGWLSRFPAWTSTGQAAIDLFSRVFADKWKLNLVTNNAEWTKEHADAARQWADHRLGDGR
ncbi:hypothetical protein GCM10022254_42830 [Actinomadura meridiana]|uniref:Aminoglycoside phosphotransferase domain-containing protein n=1 Tax=Actinomadura meridiana TaxID=559626 RepID=A0ABP8C8A2_9ACTN